MGLPEKELRRRQRNGDATGRTYRKRPRRELSPEEIERIVAATKQPYCTQKDVAKQFRVTAILVRQLVKEAKQKPEKLVALRQSIGHRDL